MKCIIVHGCPSNAEEAMNFEYDKHWIPWIRKELEEKGINVFVPLMPTPWEAKYEEWKEEFEKNEVDGDTILIGHSCGCAFLVRWLGDTKKKIKKLILVAPWKIPSNPVKEIFYGFDVDETIKSRVGEIIMFTADDEEEDGKKSLEIYHNALGGKIIELKGKGHYIIGSMGTDEFPELLGEIIS